MKLILAAVVGLGTTALFGIALFFASFGGVPDAPVSAQVTTTATVDITAQATGLLSSTQESGCQDLVILTAQMHPPGIDLAVCRAWFRQENGGNPGQPANNFLFIACTGGPCMSLAGRDWATYPTPAAGAAAIAQLLGTKPYAGVVASFGSDPLVQLTALGESPWCECHYQSFGGAPGATLVPIYEAVKAQGVTSQTPTICGPGLTMTARERPTCGPVWTFLSASNLPWRCSRWRRPRQASRPRGETGGKGSCSGVPLSPCLFVDKLPASIRLG